MTTTFALTIARRDAVLAELAAMGFVVDGPRPAVLTVLDTFDGRLHAKGLRLTSTDGATAELQLSGAGVVTARAAAPAGLRFVTDLRAGPFRSRLEAIVEVRALLPMLTMAYAATRATLLDGFGKVVARVQLLEDLRSIDGELDPIQASSTIEVVAATGHQRRAAETEARLAALGLARRDVDTVGLVAAAAGIDLRGHVDSPTVPLDPTMPSIEGYRAVLANLADTVDANWQGAIDETDPEFLHDLRVAVRRTRAVLAHGKQVLPPAVVGRASEGLAGLGELTGRPRDLDVYLLEWDSYTKPLEPNVIDALAPAHAALHQRCRDAHAVLVAGLESVEARQLLAQWRHWLVAGIGEQGREAAFQPLGPRVARRIHKAQATLIERGRLIGPTSPPEQIHDLRKDAKKLRYLFECFGSLLADKPRKSFVRRLKAFQDNLGEYQDAEVHADELAGIARQLPPHQATPDTLLAIGQVIGLLDHRRAAARAEFDERFAVYDSKSTRRALDGALSAIER